jgi:hypothetical protein
MTITTKTADILATMAYRAQAISDAVYETDKDIGAELSAVATKLSMCARALQERLERYAAVVEREKD